jgi:hypothetical protein
MPARAVSSCGSCSSDGAALVADSFFHVRALALPRGSQLSPLTARQVQPRCSPASPGQLLGADPIELLQPAGTVFTAAAPCQARSPRARQRWGRLAPIPTQQAARPAVKAEALTSACPQPILSRASTAEPLVAQPAANQRRMMRRQACDEAQHLLPGLRLPGLPRTTEG